jgi:MOSC domain-containing protein YiiM
VIRQGNVRAGEPVRLEPFIEATLSVGESFRDAYVREWDEAMLRRHLAAPIAIRERVELDERLAQLLAERREANL